MSDKEQISLLSKYHLKERTPYSEIARDTDIPRRTVQRYCENPGGNYILTADRRDRIRNYLRKVGYIGSEVIDNSQQGELEMEKATIKESTSDKHGEHSNPLTDIQAQILLKYHETIRDPVHYDIFVTRLERAIIDTPAFQRLRGIKQLGPIDLVYPGATHTRFLHSIGTVYMADTFVQIINRNYNNYVVHPDKPTNFVKIGPYEHLLIRLYALLHDVAHMPFGHTLENEGGIVAPEWEDDARKKLWLMDDSEHSISRTIKNHLVEMGIAVELVDKFITDLRTYITVKDPMILTYPYIKDIVGNTLCADLLDYLDRDMYFCGLKERSGDRVVQYLAVMKVEPTMDVTQKPPTEYVASTSEYAKGRVVLLTYRYEQAHSNLEEPKVVEKLEILSEAIDFLRRRYALAEKVYFHRTKKVASAMLISAVGSASMSLSTIYKLEDTDFINDLRKDKNERTRNLANAYKSRHLYQPLYRLDYREEKDNDAQSKQLWRDYYPNNYRKPEWRKEKEEELERLANLAKGSVVIYCPDKDMNLKEFEMLVQSRPGGEIKMLCNILDGNREKEMEAINGRFKELWRLEVFVDPTALPVSEIGRQEVQDFNALCEEIIGFTNSAPKPIGKGRPLIEQLVDRERIDWEAKHTPQTVPARLTRELVSSSNRSQGTDLATDIRRSLETRMSGKQATLDEASG